jgi:hypothetical protein
MVSGEVMVNNLASGIASPKQGELCGKETRIWCNAGYGTGIEFGFDGLRPQGIGRPGL